MQPEVPASKAAAAVAAAVLLVTILLSGGPAGAAVAPAVAATPPVTPGTAACHTDLPPVRYLVLFPVGTAAEAAGSEIELGCGRVTGYYPEIAVAVATSTDSAFAERLGRDRAYSAEAEAITMTPRRLPAGLPRTVGVQSLGAVAAAEPAADRTGEQWNLAMVGADSSQARGSTSVLVGVLDSGVDGDHPELAGALDRAASAGCITGMPDPRPSAWQPSGQHGTHVAGIITAADDGTGITGIAPGVRIAAVKVVDSKGFIYPEYAVCGLLWAARNGVRVANHSYFVDPWLLTCSDQPGQAVAHEALRRATEYATAQGVLSVAAVGNEALDLAEPRVDVRSPNNAARPHSRVVTERCDVLPAELPGVLAVSAVGASGVKSSYSSYGVRVVDVAAPGGDVRQRSPSAPSGCVLSSVPGGYGRMCGTSMAAPHASGVAALVASAHPQAGPAELAALVTASATPLACPADGYDPDSDGNVDGQCTAAESGNGFYGAGLVNAAGAVDAGAVDGGAVGR